MELEWDNFVIIHNCLSMDRWSSGYNERDEQWSFGEYFHKFRVQQHAGRSTNYFSLPMYRELYRLLFIHLDVTRIMILFCSR